METGSLVLLCLALGLIVGAGFVVLLQLAERRGNNAVALLSSSVPDGVDQVIDALGSAGLVIDPSLNVVKASSAAYTFGLVANDLLVHDEIVEMVTRVQRSGEAEEAEVVLARGPFSEASLHLEVRAARLGSRYVLVLADDRTESYRLEETRRDFIANISHELKTPIGAITLLAEALESASDDEAQVRRFAQQMGTEAARLSQITREIIELSRLQATDVLASADRIELDSIVSTAVDHNHVIAKAHDIELAVGGSKRVTVVGDEALLTLALNNLIANAIQYSPDGSRIGIGVHHDAGIAEIAVTDQGIGIPEADLTRVFERFFRVDQARSRNTGGTGLGLSIVKHVVQNHGGDIRAWSQVGHGSTFTIRLPEAPSAVATQGERR
ncbi:ATP-binding protein [Herbiconiux moechotypicola]|uniref:Sensor-like histidine kinase SenX3 n=1 Tax=Herbiconiux moechotypicola TaxID=637393 RepID=A0ABN3DRT1_9MICO|nr:ATP-binding protein [Herbiconiux moechotypicola]MCS5730683.1 ATP-binding protein [Herbiconiux moechotypicola]